jgi:hypothetical protein
MSRLFISRIPLALAAAGLIVVGAASLMAPGTASATTGINQQINFQGRLLNSAGAVVADGTYNMRFKIYCDGDGVLGSTVGACGDSTQEHLLWTETHQNSASQGVVVKNGYFSVQLGAITTLSGVDFNQQTLWLSMDVTTNATDTGGSPTYDGEMSPFKRLSSAAYALNSNQLQGMSASAFAQLAAANSFSAANTFSATNTFSKTSGAGIILSGSAAASGSILQVGIPLSVGSASGTLISSNGAFAGDLLNLQVSNATKLKVSNAGLLDAVGGFAVNGAPGTTITTCGAGTYVGSFASSGGIVTGGSCTTPAGTYSLSAAATTGGSQTLVAGDTLTIAAGTNISTTMGGTDTITVATVASPTFTSVTSPSFTGQGRERQCYQCQSNPPNDYFGQRGR